MRTAALGLLAAAAAAAENAVPYEEKYFTQTLDHFRFGDGGAPEGTTYQQRYLLNRDAWGTKPALANGCRGPILFYTGNEGAIEAFWSASGFVNHDLRTELGALVVFAEHRYYGKSLPFGDKSLEPENAKYCTTEQALADFAGLLLALKKDLGAENCPIISFGGSYGGTLTTFFRAKYPHVVAGGLAASAPFGYYDPQDWAAQGVTQYTWIDIVNKVYAEAQSGCLTTVQAYAARLMREGTTPAGRAGLQQKLGLCQTPQKATDVLHLFTDAVETLPQMDYPYAIGAAPAWPVNATCSALLAADPQGDGFYAALQRVFGFYYPHPQGCFPAAGLGGIPGGGPTGLGDGGDAWGYQSCTETLHEFSGRGVRDFTFNMTEVKAVCAEHYKVHPRPGWFHQQFGGYALNAADSPLTNVIFSNGLRDPWHGGGILKQTSAARPVFIMPNGAHHVDLRAGNAADTPDITATRQKEKAIIQQWIADASKRE